MRIANWIDGALEWTVVGSFTRVGSSVRRRTERWSPPSADLRGRVVVISGATSGLGLATAESLLRLGATVEMLARDERKAESTQHALREATGDARVQYVVADTGDLVALRRAATELLRRHATIDVLIHNAGALDDTRHTSPQGIEQTIASQVVGPFLLTGLLLPALRRSDRARVLWVSSGGMYSEPLSVDRLEMGERDYDGTTAYARAKRAQVTLAALWAERLASDGIVVQSMHPGWADTPGVARSLPWFRRIVGPLLRAPADGADTLVWLAADDGAPLTKSGSFWHDRRPRPLHRFARTRRSDTAVERARLWDWAMARSGLLL